MSRFFKKTGFSLIEVLVSLGIVGVLLSVILANQSDYTDTLAISNLAEEISLNLSEAQAYGIAVKELTPGSEDFSISYGLSFSLLDEGSNNSYILFADRNGNNIYDGDWTCPIGGSSECLEKVLISNNNYIDSICLVRANDSDECASPQRLDASFRRPNTEATLLLFDSSGAAMSPSNLSGSRLVLKSPRDNSRSVLVFTNGQISTDSEYSYQYPTPYAYEYQYPTPYAYETPYPYPTPDVIVTYSGAANGTHNLTRSGPLNLTATGDYSVSFNQGAAIRVKGVAGGGGGGGGMAGSREGGSVCGGGGGGGGGANTSGVAESVVGGTNYSARVGWGGSGGSSDANGSGGGGTNFLSLGLSGGGGGTRGQLGAPPTGGAGGSSGGGQGGTGGCYHSDGLRGGNGSPGAGGGGGGGGSGRNTIANGGPGGNSPDQSGSGVGSGSGCWGTNGGNGGGVLLGGNYRGAGGGGGGSCVDTGPGRTGNSGGNGSLTIELR